MSIHVNNNNWAPGSSFATCKRQADSNDINKTRRFMKQKTAVLACLVLAGLFAIDSTVSAQSPAPSAGPLAQGTSEPADLSGDWDAGAGASLNPKDRGG